MLKYLVILIYMFTFISMTLTYPKKITEDNKGNEKLPENEKKSMAPTAAPKNQSIDNEGGGRLPENQVKTMTSTAAIKETDNNKGDENQEAHHDFDRIFCTSCAEDGCQIVDYKKCSCICRYRK